jgi:hypothetical protein
LRCKDSPPAVISSNNYWNLLTCKLECVNVTTEIAKGIFETVETCTDLHSANEKCQCVCDEDNQEPADYNRTMWHWNQYACDLQCNSVTTEITKGIFKTNKTCTDLHSANENCQCVCDEEEPADYNRTIQQWNLLTCELECFSVTTEIAEGIFKTDKACTDPHKPNENCQCVCPNHQQEPANYNRTIVHWNLLTCELECFSVTTEIAEGIFKTDKACTYPHVPNKNCQCVCDEEEPLDYNRTVQQWNNDICDIICIRTDIDCGAYHVPNKDCECACPRNMEEPPAFNRDIKKWNEEKCMLECISPKPLIIPEGKIWNEENCAFDCNIQCELPYGKSPTACECICLPTLPIKSCNEERVWNSTKEICHCNCPPDKQKPAEYDYISWKWNEKNCEFVDIKFIDPECSNPNTESISLYDP